jgi:hypothetical protein
MKGDLEMLSLELIGIVGVLLGLLTYGMVVAQLERGKPQRARKQAQAS